MPLIMLTFLTSAFQNASARPTTNAMPQSTRPTASRFLERIPPRPRSRRREFRQRGMSGPFPKDRGAQLNHEHENEKGSDG